MSTTHVVTFYPVGNGDTTQVVTDAGRRILFDFCHREKSEDADTPEIDLKKQLKEDLAAAKRDDFDVVAFTHADNDHIQGSTEFFELEHAKRYMGDGRVKIKELWVPAAMLIEKADKDHQEDEFVLLRQEARHRLLEGKGIRVFSKPPELLDIMEPMLKARGESRNSRDHLYVDAGTLVPGFTLEADQIEFFCHSPFIEHCEGGDVIRNQAALVFNVRFAVGDECYDYLEIGDAEYCDLEKIVEITDYHKNNDRLEWNLLNIPHHCSYRALSNKKGDRETEPSEGVKKLLMMGREESYVVSCSHPVTDTAAAYDQNLPPHIQARKAYERYVQEVDGRDFLVTMEEPNGTKPLPLVFNIQSGGVTWDKAKPLGSAGILTTMPPRAGYDSP